MRGAGYAVAAVDRVAAPAAHEYAAFHVVDVTDPAAVDAVVDAVEFALGPVEVLVNAAGVLVAAPALSTAMSDWSSAWAANATGVFVMSCAVARRMQARRRGSIVTVGSNAAAVPRVGMAAYGASKAAATAFTRTLGLELAEYGIRCNVVSPGSTDSPMLRSLAPDSDPGDLAAALIAGEASTFKLGIPLGRIADPADIAVAVQFLASDAARHITMHDLRVDGGATLDA